MSEREVVRRHIWINPTAIDVTFGQVAWQGNVPSEGTLLGYYAVCYSKALNTQQKSRVFIRIPVLFNDAFGAVWYSRDVLFLGSPTSGGNNLIYYAGDLFRFPIKVSEGMLSIALTTIVPDLIDKFAISNQTVDGTTFQLGTALLVEV